MKTFKDLVNEVAEPLSKGEQNFKALHGVVAANRNLVPGVTDQDFLFKGEPRRFDQPTASYEKDESETAYDKTLKVEEDVNEALGTIKNMKAASKFGSSNVSNMIRGEKQRLSDKQKKIAAVAGHPGKIDAADFAALRSGKKVKEEIEIDEKMNDAQKTAVRSVQKLRANLHKDGHLDTKPSISDTKRTIKFVKNEEVELEEKTLTPAEMKKREVIAKAMGRENPNMPMGKKMAIATATAKKVAEELKGNQHKLDANKNNKIDAGDFELLKKKKMRSEETVDVSEGLGDRYTNDPIGNFSGLKAHAKKLGSKHKDYHDLMVAASHMGFGNKDHLNKHIKKLDPEVRNKIKEYMKEEANQIDELKHSGPVLNNYLSKTNPDRNTPKENEKRAAGRSLALRKKWGKSFALSGVKVPKVSATNEEINLEEAVTVNKKNYSWGKMITIHHGASHSFPLHPEHQEAIAKLKHGESTSFTDETKSKVTAHRDGDTVHLSLRGSNTKTPVAMSHFKEEADQIDEIHSIGSTALTYHDHIEAKKMTTAEIKAKHKSYLDTEAHHRKRSKDPNLTSNQRMASNAVASAAKMAAAEWKHKYVKEEAEMDYEGQMAKAELNAIADKAATIADMLDNNTQMEAWLQSKISRAKDYVDAVYDYMMYSDKEEPTSEPEDYTQSNAMASNYGQFINRMGEEVELDEAKRGRPSKNASANDESGREHIVVQLRKVVNLRGARPVEFNDNSKKDISVDHAKKALEMHSSMKPIQKGEFESRLAKSHSSFHSAIKGEPPEKAKPKISLGSMRREQYDIEEARGTIKASDKRDRIAITTTDPKTGRPFVKWSTLPKKNIKVTEATDKTNMQQDSIDRLVKLSPLASKMKVKLPPTQGNKPIGGEDQVHPSMAEETLNRLYESLSEVNKEKFLEKLDTKEGIDALLQFAQEQGF